MNNDLISRSELKKAIEGLVVGGAEGLKNYYENGSKSDENAWIGGVYDAWELVDNAPTVEQKEFEQVLQPIKVNIPEDIKDKLIEELSKPRKIIFDEAPTFEPVITEKQAILLLINSGWLVNHDKELREKWERPHGEWIYTPDIHDLTEYEGITCSLCGCDSVEDFNFCPNCGADMRKPNCVTCDHFGKCEGCEKGEEE